MALTKVGSGGIENVTNSANATFLTVDASEQITVASEGGAVTTSIQQGVAKAWVHFDGNLSTPAIDDSFNMSSISDLNTASYEPVLTNNFSASGGYSASGTASWNSSGGAGAFVTTIGDDYSTSGVGIYSYRSNNYDQIAAIDITLTYHGDLA